MPVADIDATAAFALAGVFAALPACWEEENPYDKTCNWMATDYDECEGMAVNRGCVDWSYNSRTLACRGNHCISCTHLD